MTQNKIDFIRSQLYFTPDKKMFIRYMNVILITALLGCVYVALGGIFAVFGVLQLALLTVTNITVRPLLKNIEGVENRLIVTGCVSADGAVLFLTVPFIPGLWYAGYEKLCFGLLPCFGVFLALFTIADIKALGCEREKYNKADWKNAIIRYIFYTATMTAGAIYMVRAEDARNGFLVFLSSFMSLFVFASFHRAVKSFVALHLYRALKRNENIPDEVFTDGTGKTRLYIRLR